MEIYYPVHRLLANPRIFWAIANYIGGPDGDILKDSFYELLELSFQDNDEVEELEFEASEVCFRIHEESGAVDILFDTGVASVLKPVEGEVRANITNDLELAATTAIYKRIVEAIEKENPAFTGNIALCSPPTPGNSYLRTANGEGFHGEFHLLTDPNEKFAFVVNILDVNADVLQATYRKII